MESEPDEYQLAVRARSGDTNALAELTARTRGRLFALAYAETGNYDDAHDAVANALLQICLHARDLKDPARVRAWMTAIVRREARRLRRRPRPVSLDERDAPTDRTDSLGASLLRADIALALRRLPPSQADALRLFYLDGLSVADIAAHTGRPPGTVRVSLHRARQNMALQMKGYEPMPKKSPSAPADDLESAILAAAQKSLAQAQTLLGQTFTPEQLQTMTDAMVKVMRERGIDPRIPEPPKLAAVAHSDLSAELLEKIVQILESSGFTPTVLTPAHFGVLTAASLTETLTPFQLIVLDEQIVGRPALEFVLNLKGGAAKNARLVVLGTGLDPFSSAAYFTAGVDKVVAKDDLQSLLGLAFGPSGGWQRFTEAARKTVFYAQEEARALGSNFVAPEHLLLGLLRAENAATRALERMDIETERMRTRILVQAKQGTDTDSKEDMQLTAESKRVIDLAYNEANRMDNNFVGSEHLLLGILREGESQAARVLRELGVTLARAREEVTAGQKAG